MKINCCVIVRNETLLSSEHFIEKLSYNIPLKYLLSDLSFTVLRLEEGEAGKTGVPYYSTSTDVGCFFFLVPRNTAFLSHYGSVICSPNTCFQYTFISSLWYAPDSADKGQHIPALPWQTCVLFLQVKGHFKFLV